MARVPGGQQGLARDQVVELEHGQAAALDQPDRVELRVLGVHQSLRVGQPGAHRLADAQRMPFEREETHHVGTVVHDGHPDVVTQGSDRDRELRRQERAVEGRRRGLEVSPPVDVRWSELARVNDRDAHGLLLVLGACGFPYALQHGLSGGRVH
nr:hypothetical protein GCM10020093_052570 [Planobispora longispora]